MIEAVPTTFLTEASGDCQGPVKAASKGLRRLGILCGLMAAASLLLALRSPDARAAGMLGPPPENLEQTYYGEITASSHVIHAGEEITFTESPKLEGTFQGWGYEEPVNFPGYVKGCTKTSVSCTFREEYGYPYPAPGKPTNWVIYGAGFCGFFGCANYDTYYYTLGTASISGYVLEGSGRPVPDATVSIAGPEGTSAQTNEAGFYSASLEQAGPYKVSVSETGGVEGITVKECSGKTAGNACEIELEYGSTTASFTAQTKPSGVSISAGNPVPEPATGSVPATFTINLPSPQSEPVTVDYKTADGTATAAANDYTPVPDGSVRIPAGETSAQIQVEVDDGSGQASAPTESFEVELTSTGSSGLEISARQGSAFGLIEVPGLHGSVYDLNGNGLEKVPLKLSGTASSGAMISRTLSTNTAGGYQVNVDPGTYNLAPNGDPPSEPAGLEYGANPCPGSASKGACNGIVLSTGLATASFTYGCGANLELKSVSHGVEHTHGARINTPVTLDGKGFCAGMSIQFGNAKAVVNPPPESIGPGGTSVEVTVPRLATSGTLSVTSGGKTKSLPETFAVDSFRDTDAFGFENFDAPPTLADFLHTFGVQSTMQPLVINVCPGGQCQTTELVPTQATLDAYANLSRDFGGGVCWGWDFEAQRLSDGGDTPLASISPEASVPWDLAETPELKTKIIQMQWAQDSNQVSAIQRTSPTPHTGATILAEVTAALQGGVEAGSNGAMIGIEAYYKKTGWEGHELLAYDVEPQPNGGFNIEVADPNQQFTAGENASDGSAHAAALQRSTIAVGPGGRWSYAPLGWQGNSRHIDIEPYPALINAIHGGLTFSQPGAGRLKTSIAPATTLSSLIDPAGQAVEIEEPSTASGVNFTPVRNGGGPADYSFEGPEGTYAQTLSGAAPSEVISTDGLLADIEASSGTDAVSFDPQTASLEFGSSASPATPSARAFSSSARARSAAGSVSHTATLSLVANSAAAERTVKLSGPSGAGLSLAFTHSQASVKLSGSGTYTLTLSAAGQASAVKLKVEPGEKVTLKPRWSALSGKEVLVNTRGNHGRPRSELLGDRLSAPDAAIRKIKDAGRSVAVGLDLPPLVSGSSVNVYVTVLRGSRKLAQQSASLVPTEHASHRHLRLKLSSTPPRGSAIDVLAVTRSDASPPQIATSERTIHPR